MMAWATPQQILDNGGGLFRNNFRKWRAIGSAALSCAYFAVGRGDAYTGFDNNLWDIAAGAVIAKEAGARLTNDKGIVWNINFRNIVAANKILHKKILAAIK